MRRLSFLMAVAISIVASGLAQAKAVEFKVADPMGRNVATYTTTAPLETIVGTTNQVTGFIKVDPENILDHPEGRFVIDLASLNSGIALRDKDMREKFLQTDQFPNAVFTLTRVFSASSKKLEDGKPVVIRAEGTVEIHGVKRTIPVTVKCTYFRESAQTKAKMPGDLVVVNANFDTKLSEFNIERPQMVFLKVSDDVTIGVNAVGTTANAEKMANPCNPCQAKKNPCQPKANPCAPKNPCQPKNPCTPENPCKPK